MYRLTAHAKSSGVGTDPCQHVLTDLERAMGTGKLGNSNEPRSCTDTVHLSPWVEHVAYEALPHLYTLGHPLRKEDAYDVCN